MSTGGRSLIPSGSTELHIEDLGEGRILARGRHGDEEVEVRVFIDSVVTERAGVSGAPTAAVAEATLEYLLTHQRLDELPAQLDLEDVAAAYPDYEEQLSASLRGR